jgi:hypothetical protein
MLIQGGTKNTGLRLLSDRLLLFRVAGRARLEQVLNRRALAGLLRRWRVAVWVERWFLWSRLPSEDVQ